MNTIKLKLLQPHRHDGRDHAAGDIIEVPPAIAEWLLSRKQAEPAPVPPAPPVAPKGN